MNTMILAATAWAALSIPVGIAVGRLIGEMGDDETAASFEQLLNEAADVSAGSVLSDDESRDAAPLGNRSAAAIRRAARRRAVRPLRRRPARVPRHGTTGGAC